jgi:hypothetical protein
LSRKTHWVRPSTCDRTLFRTSMLVGEAMVYGRLTLRITRGRRPSGESCSSTSHSPSHPAMPVGRSYFASPPARSPLASRLRSSCRQ